MLLTEEQVEHFKSKGFLILRGVYDATEMGQVSVILDELRDKESAKGRDAKYYETSPVTGENMLVRIEKILGDHNAKLTKILFAPKAIECLTQLCGEAPVLFKDKINYKLPGCRPDKIHQDQAAGWGRYSDFFVTMTVTVDENKRDNAAMRIMASGKYERKLMGEEWQPLAGEDLENASESEYMWLETNPGDVIFFDVYVPHGSPANTSNRSRRNIFLTFNRLSDGDMRAQYYTDKWENYAPNKVDDARSEDSFRV
jgi:ectoine hydroxylase-related dioxygenase (phytanoyl-CoA dioxygenase family)